MLQLIVHCSNWQKVIIMYTYEAAASRKSNYSSRPRCIPDRTLLYPGSRGRRWQLWRVYPDGGYYDIRWLTGLWSTQAKVTRIVPRAAWHWGRDSTVVNDPLGEPDRTSLYVGLPNAWGSVEGDLTFSPYAGRFSFRDSGRPTWMNE